MELVGLFLFRAIRALDGLFDPRSSVPGILCPRDLRSGVRQVPDPLVLGS